MIQNYFIINYIFWNKWKKKFKSLNLIVQIYKLKNSLWKSLPVTFSTIPRFINFKFPYNSICYYNFFSFSLLCFFFPLETLEIWMKSNNDNYYHSISWTRKQSSMYSCTSIHVKLSSLKLLLTYCPEFLIFRSKKD